MNLKLKLHNHAFQGETKYLVHLDKDATFETLRAHLVLTFKFLTFRLKYHGYNVSLE